MQCGHESHRNLAERCRFLFLSQGNRLAGKQRAQQDALQESCLCGKLSPSSNQKTTARRVRCPQAFKREGEHKGPTLGNVNSSMVLFLAYIMPGPFSFSQ